MITKMPVRDRSQTLGGGLDVKKGALKSSDPPTGALKKNDHKFSMGFKDFERGPEILLPCFVVVVVFTSAPAKVFVNGRFCVHTYTKTQTLKHMC